ALRELMRRRTVPESVRTVNLYAEIAPTALAVRIYGSSRIERVFQSYGRPESGYSTRALLPRQSENGSIPLGQTLMNTQVYVLDKQMELLPVGVVGELYLGGVGLARGYMNEPTGTASRFVPSPFSEKEGERLYRTGDRVKYGRNGELEWVGRVEEEVRVRGRRIQLSRIETALQQQAEVEDAVVLQATDGRLMAYVIPAAIDEKREAWEQKWRETLKTQ